MQLQRTDWCRAVLGVNYHVSKSKDIDWSQFETFLMLRKTVHKYHHSKPSQVAQKRNKYRNSKPSQVAENICQSSAGI